jgi:hypothetical protein
MRDQTCTFPGCDTRASDCQLDHTRPHPKGRTEPGRPGDEHATSVDGLGSLCDSDHRMKTLGGWHITHTPTGWEWTSPHGKIYTTTTLTYSPQTLAELATAETTRIDLADLVADEHDDHALTQAARKAAVDAVLYAANPAPF